MLAWCVDLNSSEMFATLVYTARFADGVERHDVRAMSLVEATLDITARLR